MESDPIADSDPADADGAATPSSDPSGRRRAGEPAPGWSSTWGDGRAVDRPPPPPPSEPPDHGEGSRGGIIADPTASQASPPAPAASRPTASPVPPAPRARPHGRNWNVVATVGLAVALAVAAWWALRPEPVSLSVDGTPIANGDVVLADAERTLQVIVDADGSSVSDGTACFFAPDPAGGSGPRVACGPVLLGISPPDQPWLVGTVDWGFPDETVSGEFVGFDGTTTGDPGGLRRPDGRAPIEADLAVPTSGLRTVEGARITNAGDTLGATEELLGAAVAEAGAATDEDTACWFEVLVDGRDRMTTDGTVWCGPVLTLESDPTEPWVTATASESAGEVLSTAVLSPPSSIALDTMARGAGATLWRPDGVEPPDAVDLELPDAPPADPGYAAVLDQPLADLRATTPDDGLVRTPDMTWTITGLARTDRLGAGPEAIVAPEDHELVVARSAFTVDEDRSFDPGVATLVVDGRRRPLEVFSEVDTGSTALVVVVPEGADEVVVEVLSHEVSQAISLRTGDKQPGFPAGMYRSSEPVGVGRALTATVDLPDGEPGRAAATISSVELRGFDDDLGWPAHGEVFAVVTFAALDAETPCCELDDLEVTAVPTLAVEGRQREVLAEGSDTVTWAVPADATHVDLALRAEAAWTDGSGSNRASGSAGPVTVELP